jgi:glutamate racemase
LSVLRALRQQWPEAPLLYVADSAHAPYGERSDDYVLDRSRRIMMHLLEQGAVGVVIACNTATAIAARALRAEFPDVPIVGVEPGLKPAIAATRNGRVGVMATRATLSSAKFKALVDAQGSQVTVHAQPCPGLARLIEDGELDSSSVRDAVIEHTAALRAADVDTVVLGCTHYPFVRHHIEAVMGQHVHVVDTADAVARHAVNTMRNLLQRCETPAPVRLETTGDPIRLQAIARAWLPFDTVVTSCRMN